MSSFRDALDGIKAILLLQNGVKTLEKEIERQRDAVGELGDDLIALDKRVVRIETMIEMSGRGGHAPRLEG